ncbi:MAG: TonB-dependent receptor [Pseudomonadota bacterium]|nr:TonB-dependent receptor [Pseudomonadota bacterium]
MKNMNLPYKKLAVAIATLLTTPVIHAQEADVANPGATEDSGLEIIQVTSQRRVENLQEVPVSVTAISPTELERKNVSDVYQMTLNAPSFQIGEDNSMSIRGAGTLAFSSSLDSSVAVAFDEVNLGRRYLMGAVFNDISQIEVLSGPQGLLFGKNASAGLVNITSTKPQLGYTEGKIDVEYQLRDTTPQDGRSIITRGMYNIPLTDNSALRINAHYAAEDPVARAIKVVGDPKLDEETTDWGVKLKYLNELSEDVSVYVIADTNRESGVAGNFDRTFRSIGEGSGKLDTILADGVVPGDENLDYGADADNFRDVEMGGLMAKVTWAVNDNYELSNITAWRYFELVQGTDDNMASNELNINFTTSEYDQFSNETRLSMDFDNMRGQVGLYYFHSTQSEDRFLAGDGLLPAFLLPNFPFCVGAEVVEGGMCSVSNDHFIGNDTVMDMETDSAAIFGQFDFLLTDDLTLTTGLRYTYDEIYIDLANFQRYNFFTTIGTPALREETNSSDNVSGKVSLQYQLDDDKMVYASYSRGYKGPGYTNTPSPEQTDIFIQPEVVDNYEIGAKTVWLDNHLIVNASVFDQQFDDYQVQAFDATISQSVIQNAASLSSTGVELSITAMPFESLTVNGGATLMDSQFDSFPGAACYPQQPDCDENGTFDAAGLTPPTAAKFTSTASATYDFELPLDGYGFVTLNYYHRDPVNYLISNAPQTRIGNVDQFGLNIGVRLDNGWDITLFCKNCTDEKVPVATGIDAGDSAQYGTTSVVQSWGFNSVRNIGLRVSYGF